MAGSLTAVVTLSNSTVTANQKTPACTVTLAVSNSAATAVNVTAIEPYVYGSGSTNRASCAIGKPAFGPGMTVAVPGSGSLNFYYDIVPHAPQPGNVATTDPMPANPASQTLTVGAWVTGADGSYAQATTADLTVNAPTHSLSGQGNQ